MTRSNCVDLSGSRALRVAPVAFAMATLWCSTQVFAQYTDPNTTTNPYPTEPQTFAAPPVEQPASAPATAPVEPNVAPSTVTVPLSPPGVVEELPKLALPGPESDGARARLDYSDGSFYLRAWNDNLILVPSGRLQIDGYGFAGQGVSDYQRANGSGLKTNVFFRRFVMEMGGIVRKQWFFWLGGAWQPQGIDGSNPAQTVANNANVYDAFIGWMPTPNVRFYFGQYNAPFTMENVTSSRWLDFMERSLIIRTAAIPANKGDGLMLWADTADHMLEVQAGVFGADGQNRPNIDGDFDGMGRLVFRPLAKREDALNRMHIGVSGRFGWRDHKFVRYDTPGMSTPGGYSFWGAGYGTGADARHILPSSYQGAFAAEFLVPLDKFDFRGEFVYVDEGRREAPDDRSKTLRNGALTGIGGYLQASFWLIGTARVNGNPAGFYGALKVPEGLGKQADYGLQLALRAELVRLNYNSNSRAGDNKGDRDAMTENIDVNGYQIALNFWATKHVRLTAEYSLYQFPGKPKAENQATAPGVSVMRANADLLHEFSIRAGLAL